VSRKFLTVMELPKEPDWRPLEAVSRLARASPDLPSFHAMEFMHMGIVRPVRKGSVIHLYKHVDTRRYLNLDDGGHAYKYCFEPDREIDLDGPLESRYRQIPLIEALEHVELWRFASETDNWFRSYGPEDWPSDEAERSA
jgi:hypothetical protein